MNILETYTLSSITVNFKQDFCLKLLTPREQDIIEIKNYFSMKIAEIDDDGDFVGSGGSIQGADNVLIKDVKLLVSENKAQITCLSAKTEQCYIVLYYLFKKLFDVEESECNLGIDYVGYDTITKVQFKNPIYSIFSKQMEEQILKWKNLSSNEVINVIKDGEFYKNQHKGIVDICEEKYNTMFSGQKSAIILPSRIEFTISIPTNYYKLSHYNVSLAVKSIEEFQQNIYFLKSEFPYETHVKLFSFLENN